MSPRSNKLETTDDTEGSDRLLTVKGRYTMAPMTTFGDRVSFEQLVDGLAAQLDETYGPRIDSVLDEMRESTEGLVTRLRVQVLTWQWDSMRLALATVLADAPTRPEWAEAARAVLAEFTDDDPEGGPPEAT